MTESEVGFGLRFIFILEMLALFGSAEITKMAALAPCMRSYKGAATRLGFRAAEKVT